MNQESRAYICGECFLEGLMLDMLAAWWMHGRTPYPKVNNRSLPVTSEVAARFGQAPHKIQSKALKQV